MFPNLPSPDGGPHPETLKAFLGSAKSLLSASAAKPLIACLVLTMQH